MKTFTLVILLLLLPDMVFAQADNACVEDLVKVSISSLETRIRNETKAILSISGATHQNDVIAECLRAPLAETVLEYADRKGIDVEKFFPDFLEKIGEYREERGKKIFKIKEFNSDDIKKLLKGLGIPETEE